MKREVFYVLQRQSNDRTQCEPVATYALEYKALQDGALLNVGSWHPVVTRHSIPQPSKFEWSPLDIVIDNE